MKKKFKKIRKFKKYEVEVIDLFWGLLWVSLTGSLGVIGFLAYILIVRFFESEVYYEEIKLDAKRGDGGRDKWE